MLTDLETRRDLELLLTEFYRVAMSDAVIGHYFTIVVRLDLPTHLPIIVNFWEKVLFGAPVYFGNPMIVHRQMHEKSGFAKEHFDRWLEIFTATVDRLFADPTAEKAKEKAEAVASAMFAALVKTTATQIYSVTR